MESRAARSPVTAKLGTQTALVAYSQYWSTAVVRYKSGEIKYSPFPFRCPRGGVTLHSPLPSPKDVERIKEITKERTSNERE